MDFINYIRNVRKENDFIPTGVTKRSYIDILEKCLDAYSFRDLESRLPKTKDGMVDDLQAISRITCALGVMLAHGRKKEYKSLWVKMMDACCNDFYRRMPPNTLDFAVKEIMLSYKAMKDHVDEKKKSEWLENLAKIDPYRNYSNVLREDTEADRLYNWNVYNMAGEYLRETEGLTDTSGYFEKHWSHQLNYFDKNGMYMDPNNPILYDLTTRCHAQFITGFGYRGKYFEAIDTNLRRAGLYTLFMQSANFELPFGGRSNQYIFNEALIAANCEYEAARYAGEGDASTAGMFKRAGHLALKAMLRWLEEIPPRHIKNLYPVDSKFGTENYGYYDKYMMTAGSFIYIAYLFADDSIEEFPCPAETGGYFLQTSEEFHKIFANCNGQSIQIDTKADPDYDATGLGRYHKYLIPSEMALSIPFTATPHYFLPESLSKENISLCTGWEDETGNIIALSDLHDDIRSDITIKGIERNKIEFDLLYSGASIKGCSCIKESYLLSVDGLCITSVILNPSSEQIYFYVPIFITNGKDITNININNNTITVVMDKFKYIISSNGIYQMDKSRYGNRNGEYGLALFKRNRSEITIKLSLTGM